MQDGMARRDGHTQAKVRRNIKAARLEGLRVAGIKPDGTIIVCEDQNPLVPVDQSEPPLPDLNAVRRWGDDVA
jgi:hypothetical protein